MVVCFFHHHIFYIFFPGSSNHWAFYLKTVKNCIIFSNEEKWESSLLLTILFFISNGKNLWVNTTRYTYTLITTSFCEGLIFRPIKLVSVSKIELNACLVMVGWLLLQSLFVLFFYFIFKWMLLFAENNLVYTSKNASAKILIHVNNNKKRDTKIRRTTNKYGKIVKLLCV